MLSNTAPSASADSKYSDISANELANGNGYTTGGASVSGVGASNSSGTESIAGDAVSWTATGTMGPFRYVIVYDYTATNKPLLWYFDYGSNLTLNSGDSFTATPSGDVLLTIA